MAGVGVGISDDLISLEIASPDVPDLTLIDLPGIARVAVKGQPENIGDQVAIFSAPKTCCQQMSWEKSLVVPRKSINYVVKRVFLSYTQFMLPILSILKIRPSGQKTTTNSCHENH